MKNDYFFVTFISEFPPESQRRQEALFIKFILGEVEKHRLQVDRIRAEDSLVGFAVSAQAVLLDPAATFRAHASRPILHRP